MDIDKLITFENDELSLHEIIDQFQELVTTGLAWSLQGFFGRTANRLIELGYVNA